jgi:class 3 adenylate cyclase/predicted ATPase
VSAIAVWLDKIGLGQYAAVFADNAVDIDILTELTDADLERMGVLLGHRKAMLRSIRAMAAESGASSGATDHALTPSVVESRSVMQAAAAQRPAERRHLTVLFCDLVESTTLSSHLDPEDFSRIISDFQSVCAQAIAELGGYTARFMGDGLLAYFGYPRAHEDDAGRAVKAGLSLVEKVGALSLPSGEPLQVRIGIATGLVVVDTIAGGQANEKAAIGETPNLAARLQSMADPNSVLIAENTFRLVHGHFVCESKGTHELKGIAGEVPVWRVVSESAGGGRFGRRHREILTPFIGRKDELEQLTRLWNRSRQTDGQAILISGEAGIGKSRIVEALQEQIADEDHIVLRYHCSPYYDNTPLRPIIGQIEQEAGFERDDNPGTKLCKLEKLLNKTGPSANADFGLYASLLSIPGATRPADADMTPRRTKELTINALIRYFRISSQSQPVLIIVEDAHWIDPTTLELLDRLIQDLASAAICVVVTARPEFVAPWADNPNATMIRLNRLSREQCSALLLNMTDGKTLPAEIHEQIVSKTDGVPLFIEELTRTVIESGLMHDQGDRFAISGTLPALAIPATLQDSLMARLDRLGPSREIAQIGAALGRSFSHQLIAAVAPISEKALHAALHQLSAADLVYRRGEPPDATYIFKHALVQDVAYESLLRSRRSQLHSRIADVLSGHFADTVENEPEIMAHHLAQAGRLEEAIAYLRKAGERAVLRSANVEAIRHLQKGLDLLQMLPESSERERVQLGIDVILGQALIAGRGYAASETKDVLLRAKGLLHHLTESSDRFAVLYGIWACYYVAGEVALQQQAAVEFLKAAEQAKDRAALCIAHRTLGTTYVTMGEFVPGRRHLEEARSLYDPLNHARFRYQYGQDIGAAGLCYLSWALWHLGHVEQAAQVAKEAVASAERLGHPHTTAYTICHARGMLDVFRRDASGTIAYTEVVIALCQEHGFPFWAAGAEILNGWAKFMQNQPAEGIEVLQAGLKKWRKTGARLWLPLFLAIEAQAYAAIGRMDRALVTIEQAIAVASETGERWAIAEILRVKAALILAASSAGTAEAEALLSESITVSRTQQARSWELRASCDLARLWQQNGRPHDALLLLQDVIGQFKSTEISEDLVTARATLRDLTTSLAGLAGQQAASVNMHRYSHS